MLTMCTNATEQMINKVVGVLCAAFIHRQCTRDSLCCACACIRLATVGQHSVRSSCCAYAAADHNKRHTTA